MALPGKLDSVMFNATSPQSANDTLPLILRALRFTVRSEKLLLRKVSRLILRFSGLQTLANAISDALGMQAPLAGPNGGNGVDTATGRAIPQTWTGALLEAFELGNTRSLGGMFNFLFSRWAFACLALVWQRPSPPWPIRTMLKCIRHSY